MFGLWSSIALTNASIFDFNPLTNTLRSLRMFLIFFNLLIFVFFCFLFFFFVLVVILILFYFSDNNGIWTYNHSVPKRTINHLAKQTKWLSCVVGTYLYGVFDCIMSRPRFRVNLQPIIAWMSRNTLPESHCCHLKLRYRACFEQGLPWHWSYYWYDVGMSVPIISLVFICLSNKIPLILSYSHVVSLSCFPSLLSLFSCCLSLFGFLFPGLRTTNYTLISPFFALLVTISVFINFCFLWSFLYASCFGLSK